ncbi:hypothetical protein D9M73_187960 [compost metagenome]
MYSPAPSCAIKGGAHSCSARAATIRCRSFRSRLRAARKCCKSTGNRSPPCRCGNCPVKNPCRVWFIASSWPPAAPAISWPCSTVASKAPAASLRPSSHCVVSCLRTSRFWSATVTRPRWCVVSWPLVACAACTCRTRTRCSPPRKPMTYWPGCAPAPNRTPSARSRPRWPA